MEREVIDNARKEIDRINGELTALLVERMKQVDIIGSWKAAQGLPVHVPEREEAVIANVRELAGEGFAVETEEIFRTIFAVSCAREKRLAAQKGK